MSFDFVLFFTSLTKKARQIYKKRSGRCWHLMVMCGGGNKSTQRFVCLFVLRFYGPVNPMGSCRARSVYLTTHLLGRLSPLSGLPVLCTFFRQKLTTALLESAEGRE